MYTTTTPCCRLTYNASQSQTNTTTLAERVGNSPSTENSFVFSSLPGNTTYSIIVVVIHLNGQRVLSTPVQYTLPGYGQSVCTCYCITA